MSEHVASAIIPTGSGKSFIAGLTKVTACKECGGNDFFWATHYIPSQSIPEGRLRTSALQQAAYTAANGSSIQHMQLNQSQPIRFGVRFFPNSAAAPTTGTFLSNRDAWCDGLYHAACALAACAA